MGSGRAEGGCGMYVDHFAACLPSFWRRIIPTPLELICGGNWKVQGEFDMHRSVVTVLCRLWPPFPEREIPLFLWEVTHVLLFTQNLGHESTVLPHTRKGVGGAKRDAGLGGPRFEGLKSVHVHVSLQKVRERHNKFPSACTDLSNIWGL